MEANLRHIKLQMFWVRTNSQKNFSLLYIYYLCSRRRRRRKLKWVWVWESYSFSSFCQFKSKLKGKGCQGSGGIQGDSNQISLVSFFTWCRLGGESLHPSGFYLLSFHNVPGSMGFCTSLTFDFRLWPSRLAIFSLEFRIYYFFLFYILHFSGQLAPLEIF